MRRATLNFGRLLRGRGIAAVLELITVGLLARELSPGPFGNIVLIQTYVLVVRGLFNFKLYEVLVRFGVPLLEEDNPGAFKQLLTLTLLVDLLSSVAAMLVAVAGASITGRILGWESGVPGMTMLYSLVLVTYGFGTAKGILRIFDRFDILSTQLMVGPVLRLGGVIAVMMAELSMLWYVVALALATAAGNIYLILVGLGEMKRQVGSLQPGNISAGNWRDEFTGLWKFMAILYWQGNIDMLPRHVTTLLAGSILGPAGAGLLRLSREVTKVLSKPGALLRQVLFPDLVRLWVRGTGAFSLIIIRAVMISALFGSAFVLASLSGSAPLLTLALGADYAAASPLVTLFLLATTIELMGSVLRAAGYAIGHAGQILKLHLASSVLYLLLFIVITPRTGLTGPGIAACLAALVPLIGMAFLVVHGIRTRPDRLPESE